MADAYDANGNTLVSGGTAYAYDFEDRLIDYNTGEVVNVYDADGNRVLRTRGVSTTAYLIDELNPTGFPQVVEEITGGTVTATYALGELRTHQTRWESGTPAPSYYGYDAHGNVRLLADSSRVVTDHYEYAAFGNLLNVSGTTFNSFFYTGEQLDPTMGLYNLRARWYGARAGRRATADKFEGLLCRPYSQHRYMYTEGEPVNSIDPLGLPRLLPGATRTANTAATLAPVVNPTITLQAVPGGLSLLRVSPTAAAVFCIFKATGDILSKSVGIIDLFFDFYLPINPGGCRIPLPTLQTLGVGTQAPEPLDSKGCTLVANTEQFGERKCVYVCEKRYTVACVTDLDKPCPAPIKNGTRVPRDERGRCIHPE